MKKIHIFITMAIAAVLLLAFAGSAFAAPVVKYYPDGSYSVTDITSVGGVKTVKTSPSVSGSIQLASGSGGPAPSPGWRRVTITTSYYALGDLVARYVTPFYWEFSGGKVTTFRNEASRYPHPSLFYFWAGERVGTPDFNSTRTQVYSWKQGMIDFRITKYGVLAEMYPLHEIWANGNGSYVWHGHP